MRLALTVLGRPVPMGSKRLGRLGNGRAVILDDRDVPLRSWQSAVRVELQRAYPGDLLAGPVRVTAQFLFGRPLGHFGTGRYAWRVRPGAPQAQGVKPDLDKLVRALLDCLTGTVLRDDCQVVALDVGKGYTLGPERTLLTVEEWTGDAAAAAGWQAEGERSAGQC